MLNEMLGQSETTAGSSNGKAQNLYEQAISRLNCLQSNAQTIAAIQESRRQMPWLSLQATRDCLAVLGISLDQIDRLNVVHIAGTKGKGSTGAFLESILRQMNYKTGFYSSPHLIHARERIRLNGQPISEHSFAEHFFDVYNKLSAQRTQNQQMPAYFKFLTLLAFKVFCMEKVDVAIVEVGIGGEYDCTNVIQKPVVCAVTTLDLDHTRLLGKTIPEIAWHKAGIAKPESVLLSSEQSPEALEVIRGRCAERKCELFIVPSKLDAYNWPADIGNTFEFGIPGVQQYTNVSLALQLARFWLHRTNCEAAPSLLPPPPLISPSSSSSPNCVVSTSPSKIPYLDGFPINAQLYRALASCKWPGRCQILRKQNAVFFLDGAHTPISIKFCASWFLANSFSENNNSKKVLRVLIFHCTGERRAEKLLSELKDIHFDVALFCPTILEMPQTGKNSSSPALSLAKDSTVLNYDFDTELQRCEADRKTWAELIISQSGEQRIMNQEQTSNDGDNNRRSAVDLCFPSISKSLEWAQQFALNNNNNGKVEVHILVTGSLHLVGGVLSLLDWRIERAEEEEEEEEEKGIKKQ